MLKQKQRMSLQGPARRQRVSPLMLIGLSIPLVLALIAGVVFVLPHIGSHAAAAVNPNCTLIVPKNPLSAQGLATPYQLVATDAAAGPCNEANPNQSAFVQGAIINRETGQISLYNPLVIDKGTQAAVAPTAPQLPNNRVVALWFGFQGNVLTLQNPDGANALRQGRCVNGQGGTPFGEFAYCNAPNFFKAANNAIANGQLKVPALGTAKDGMTCPTVRDFSVIDMDQSDNVTTMYLVTANGTTAQNTAANAAALKNTTVAINGSDNVLLSIALDGALGCTPFMAPDLANNGAMAPSLPLDELQAAALQAAPVALVPLGDPMTLKNGNMSANKTNAYRRGVDQMQIGNGGDNGSTLTYCQNLLKVAPTRLNLDKAMTMNAASPAAGAANNLFTFLAQRLNATWGANGLNCVGLTKTASPATLVQNGNGVTVAASIAAAGTTPAVTVAANGNAVQTANAAAAQTMINGKPASVQVNGTAVTITDGAAAAQAAANANPGVVTVTVNGTAVALNDNGTAQVTINGATASLQVQATPQGATVTITNGTAVNPVAAVTVTANGAAVQFANGTAQAMINGKPATVQLQGMAVTITDGAAAAAPAQAAAAAGVTVTVNGTAVQFANGTAQVMINGAAATLQLQGAALTIKDGAAAAAPANP